MNLYGRERKLLFRNLQNDRYMVKRIPQGALCQYYDIGANVGMVSVLCRLMHPEANIYAFEPYQETYNRLVENTDNLKIKCNRLAYGNGKEYRCYKDRKTSLCNSFMDISDCEKIWSRDKLGEVCESFTIDQMIYGNYDNTCIKMDCEGAEHYLINDNKSTDKLKQIKWISIEVHEINDKLSIKNFLSYIFNNYESTHDIEISDGSDLSTQLNLTRR